MLEATALPADPMLMPTNFSDMWWVLSSLATLILLAVVVFFLRRLVEKHDEMNKTLVSLLVEQKGTDVELHAHITNDSIHCKGMNCPAIESR